MVKMSNPRLSNTKMYNRVLIRSKTKSVPERWILTVLSKADMPDDNNVNSYAQLDTHVQHCQQMSNGTVGIPNCPNVLGTFSTQCPSHPTVPQ